MPTEPRSLLSSVQASLTTAGAWLHARIAHVLAAFFAPPSTRPWPRRCAFLALAIVGVAHWTWFFHGPLQLDFEDWPKERAYLDILREAVATRTPPLHMDVSLQMTQRFLALPETMIAPHVLLLPWLTNPQFITLQACLMFLAGLAGCWFLARRFGWNAFALFAFTAVFSFNGFITCRLAAGHFMWAGYYLFPWMLLATLRLVDAPDNFRRGLELAWVVLAFFLVGSFHLAIWWMIFLIIAALARPRLLLPVGAALAVAALLCLFRIAPAAVTFGGIHREFGTGFPDFLTLGRALVVNLGYDTPFVQTPRVSLGWWEFNHFVGLPALAFALIYALKRPAFDDDTAATPYSGSRLFGFGTQPSRSPLSYPNSNLSPATSGLLLLAATILGVLSLSQFYAPIASLPLPLFNSERVTTRFISVTFFIFSFCACTRFSRESPRLTAGWQALALALLAQTGVELFMHSSAWRLITLEATHGPSIYWENSATLTAHIQPFAQETKYKLIVLSTWAFSGLAFVGSLILWTRQRSRANEFASTGASA